MRTENRAKEDRTKSESGMEDVGLLDGCAQNLERQDTNTSRNR